MGYSEYRKWPSAYACKLVSWSQKIQSEKGMNDEIKFHLQYVHGD